MSFARLGGLRGRGLNAVRGYQLNGSNVTTVKYGDTITYNVPGQPPGTIWLEQYVNGALGYNGPFTIPMKPYTLSNKDQIGTWQSNAYTYVNGGKGTLLEQSGLYVMGSAQAGVPASPVSPSPAGGTLPPGFSCVGADGATYTAAQINATRIAFNSPNWMPAGCAAPDLVSGTVGSGPGFVPLPGGTMPLPITIANAPSIPGALPSGGTVGASYNQSCLPSVFRFILYDGKGYATGASLPGCSQMNSANCDPQYFGDLGSAIQYALSRGETPYKVDSSDEPWQLIACQISPDPSKVYRQDGSLGGGFPISLVLLGGVLLYFLGRRKSS